MFALPNLVILVNGAAEGETELTAFDNALRKAGIGDLNLIRVSSIVPPGARVSPMPKIPRGSLTPAAYAKAVSSCPGQRIAACVGAGITPDGGVLMEASGTCSAAELEEQVRRMVEEAMHARGFVEYDLHLASAEHVVERVGSAIAAAVLWHDGAVGDAGASIGGGE